MAEQITRGSKYIGSLLLCLAPFRKSKCNTEFRDVYKAKHKYRFGYLEFQGQHPEQSTSYRSDRKTRNKTPAEATQVTGLHVSTS